MASATADERYFVSLINQARQDRNLSTLQIEKSLNELADSHSAWMLDTDTFSHTGQGDSSATDRMRDAGFDFSGSWVSAENIAYVSVDNDGSYRDEIDTLHQMLMDSPGHYANITNTSVGLIGVGLKVGEFNGYTVLMATQNFAKTDGQIDLDPGAVSPVNTSGANAAAQGRAGWLNDFDGRVFTRDGDGTGRNDDFRLNAVDNLARGRGGDDWMAGRGGNDTLLGGAGDDRQLGHAGADVLGGGHGADTLLGHRGDDRLIGNAGDDLMRGGGGRDKMFGGLNDDRMFGNNGNDRMFGGRGADWLHGGNGADFVNGGKGNDTLRGGKGNDVLVGGAGADSFVFREGDGRDKINGFVAGQDRLMIDEGLLSGGMNAADIGETPRGIAVDFGNGDVLLVRGPDLDADDVIGSIFLV